MDLRICLALLAGACLSAAPAQSANHTIENGDTLYSLSRSLGFSVNQLQEANPGLDSRSLKVGQIIKIPDVSPDATSVQDVKPDTPGPADEAPPAIPVPESYTVKKGDTLSSISRQSGVSVEDLKNLNELTGNLLKVGQRLRLRAAGPGALKKQDEEPEYLFVSKAKTQIDAPKLGRRQWRYIVVHHSGTNSGSAKIFDYYHRHVRGMENGMAYHFVIGNGSDSGDGEIEVGGRWLKQLQGGHLRSDEQNEVAIGICLVGDFNRNRPTRKQIAALIELISYLEKKIGRPRPQFALHRDINIRPTDCPGRYFPAPAMYKLFGAWEG